MMKLGGLDISHSWRQYLAKDIQKWCDKAVETGVMRDGDPMPEDEMLRLVDRVDRLERLVDEHVRDPGPPIHEETPR
jgi:hypothetical protein